MPDSPLAVVTGGSGFVGRHVVRALLDDKATAWRVAVLDIRPYTHESDVAADAGRVSARVGDLTVLGDVLSACTGASLVVHTATANPLDNSNQRLMQRVNVDGTRNVVEACKQCAVPRLVYLSSASIVFDGSDLVGVDETHPYPPSYIDYYSRTKAEAEKLVLAANHPPSLSTCALRPSAIFGPGDLVFIPRLAEIGAAGKSKYAIGDGTPIWDFTYVTNVSSACVKAAAALGLPDSPVAGQAYFITNCEPRPCWAFFGAIHSHLGYPPPTVHIPASLCYLIAVVIELILAVLRPVYKPKRAPSFSRQRVALMTSSRTFSCKKAKADFGYVPLVSIDDGIDRTIAHFSHLIVPPAHPASKMD
jgi:nucleoside-diphosphate-sugar epimerase